MLQHRLLAQSFGSKNPKIAHKNILDRSICYLENNLQSKSDREFGVFCLFVLNEVPTKGSMPPDAKSQSRQTMKERTKEETLIKRQRGRQGTEPANFLSLCENKPAGQP